MGRLKRLVQSRGRVSAVVVAGAVVLALGGCNYVGTATGGGQIQNQYGGVNATSTFGISAILSLKDCNDSGQCGTAQGHGTYSDSPVSFRFTSALNFPLAVVDYEAPGCNFLGIPVEYPLPFTYTSTNPRFSGGGTGFGVLCGGSPGNLSPSALAIFIETGPYHGYFDCGNLIKGNITLGNKFPGQGSVLSGGGTCDDIQQLLEFGTRRPASQLSPRLRRYLRRHHLHFSG